MDAGENGSYEYEPWYKYGIGFLVFEALIAIGVSIYSLSMGFTGKAVQFKKKVIFEKPAVVEATKLAQCKTIERELQECLKAAGVVITMPFKNE